LDVRGPRLTAAWVELACKQNEPIQGLAGRR
jgi:hypothetical protein